MKQCSCFYLMAWLIECKVVNELQASMLWWYMRVLNRKISITTSYDSVLGGAGFTRQRGIGVKLGHGIGSWPPVPPWYQSDRASVWKKLSSNDLPSTLRAKSNLMWFLYELDLFRPAHRCLIGLGSGECGGHTLNSLTIPHCHPGVPLDGAL